MSDYLDSRSRENLSGVHPDLAEVVYRAAKIIAGDSRKVSFVVIEGLRTRERQKLLLESGATTTMNSRHLTGHAVDLAAKVDGAIRWDWPLYHIIADVMKQAAEDLGVEIEWGGDWRKFKDGPHFQLPWASYPL